MRVQVSLGIPQGLPVLLPNGTCPISACLVCHKPSQQHKHKSQPMGTSDSRSGGKDGPDTRSRTKARRTQATSAWASEIVRKGCIELSKDRLAHYLGLPTTSWFIYILLDYVIGYRVNLNGEHPMHKA